MFSEKNFGLPWIEALGTLPKNFIIQNHIIYEKTIKSIE